MGNCHNSETKMIDNSTELNKLMDENLIFLRGIMFHYVGLNKLGTGLKLQNVHTLTHRYYSFTRESRAKLLSFEDQLSAQEYVKLEKTLASELEQLKRTHFELKKIYSGLQKLWFRPSVLKIKDFISSTQLENQDRVSKLNQVYSKMQRKNTEIDLAVFEINHGQQLSEDEDNLIRQVCTLTTYIHNSRHARIDYSTIRKSNKKAKTISNFSLYRDAESISRFGTGI